MNLYETFRPRSLSEFVGQSKAESIARHYMQRDMVKGKAFWLAGPSGTGKTTLARIMGASIADDFSTEEIGDGSELSVSDLERLAEGLRCPGWGRGGRVVIVNEAHGLKPQVFGQLRGILERIPPHAAWFFTTTRVDEAELFERTTADQVASRCQRIDLTNQGFASAFAVRMVEIARTIGVELGESEAVKIMRDVKNNARAALQRLEAMPALV